MRTRIATFWVSLVKRSQGDGRPSMLPSFDDPMKAVFGSLSTFILLIIVLLVCTGENIFGHSQISVVDLTVFALNAFIIMQWLGVLGTSDRFGSLFRLLSISTGSSNVEGDRDVDIEGVAGMSRFQRIATNLWIPVTCQFVLVGWLIYASGGIMGSPYGAVPVVMMLIGQSVYVTPDVELPFNPRVRDLLIFMGRVARAYCYPLLMFLSIIVALSLLQEYHPLVKTHAPPVEMAFTTMLNLFFGMCAVLVTRRADRTVVRKAS